MGRQVHDFGSSGMLAPAGQLQACIEPDSQSIARSVANAGIGVFECDLRSEALVWTRNVYDMFGIDRSCVPDRQDIVALYDAPSREALDRLRTRAIERQSGFTLDARITRPDGASRWVQITAQVESERGRAVRLIGTKVDVTRQRLEVQGLQHAAELDGLTGLANRAVFQTRFLDSSRSTLGFRPLGALVLFDIDRFKHINDQYGHAAGDACLVTFGERIRTCFPDALLTARIGGDEFAILLPSNRSLQRLNSRIAKALALLKMPVVWNGLLLEAGASHGAALARNAISYDAEEMFLHADAALYVAKRAR